MILPEVESWQSHAVTEGNSKRCCIIGDHPSIGAICHYKYEMRLAPLLV